MIDWQDKVERAKLVCVRSGAPIEPGTWYYSRLLYTDGRFRREDFCEAAWLPDDGATALSWWYHRRPPQHEDQGPRLLGKELLAQIFNDLKDSTRRREQCFAWLLGLLLMRKKVLRYLGLEHRDGAAVMLLEDRTHRLTYRMRDPQLSQQEVALAQADLSEVFDLPAELLTDAADDRGAD